MHQAVCEKEAQCVQQTQKYWKGERLSSGEDPIGPQQK